MDKFTRRGLAVGGWAFVLAVMISWLSDTLMHLAHPLLAFLVLITIIAIGVLADIVGIAATAASEVPFHAMSAKKVFGARQGSRLIRHADRVAIIFNDIIGDISGTVSGAAGAAIVFRLLKDFPLNEVMISLVMVGTIAALTVGGKAVGKGVAIRQSTPIVLTAGKVLAALEAVTGREFLADSPGEKRKNKRKGK